MLWLPLKVAFAMIDIQTHYTFSVFRYATLSHLGKHTWDGVLSQGKTLNLPLTVHVERWDFHSVVGSTSKHTFEWKLTKKSIYLFTRYFYYLVKYNIWRIPIYILFLFTNNSKKWTKKTVSKDHTPFPIKPRTVN